MHPSDIFQAVRAQVAVLVHASAQQHPARRARHEQFMLTRLLLGAAVLALMPAYLLLRGKVEPVEAGALAAAALPLLAVVVLSRSGRLGWAQAISTAGLSLLVASLALATGGVASPLLIAFAAVPTDAFLLGRKDFVLRAAAIAAAALAGVVVLDGLATGGPGFAAMPVVALAALVHATALSLLALRRRTAEATARQAAEERAQLLLDTVGDLVTWHDVAGGVLSVNAGAGTPAGLDPQDLLGRGLMQRVHVADRPLFLKALSDAAHGQGRVTATFRLILAPNQAAGLPVSYWLELNARRVCAGPEGRVAVIAVMRDVSRQRAEEEESARLRAEAQRASDVKGRFLATVSHELRTPLNAIIGFSEMLGGELADSFDAARRQEYARIIHGSGQHLLEVVNTLLDVSKIESGMMTLDQEPLDVAALARDCCALMALKASQGRVTLERVSGPDLPLLKADRRAVKQVLINLLSNAVKFTPPGGRVTLALVRDGAMLDISVSDTGIGICAADLPRLGDPFFQARGSYDRQHEGTGLGLSVVRGLIGLHGGTLSVESAPGAGTRVSVRLPIAGVEAACEPVRIATHARTPRRAFESKEPFRLTA